MRQLVQSFKTGKLTVMDVPCPTPGSQQLLVRSMASVVSSGTERMIVDFAEKSLLQKIGSRPDLVMRTIEKAMREGILTAIEAVQSRLDQCTPLGYSCAGIVIEKGSEVTEFGIGERVACAGAGYAVHAEIVSVPKHLVAKLPTDLDFESAAFTTLGAIALQGIRLAEVKLGEVTGVIGLGLLGQLTVQMLKAAGCLVIGMDINAQRAALAQRLGADAVATSAEEFGSLVYTRSSGQGADAVLITADTKSNEPIAAAGDVARNKGVVVAVGAIGMTIPRGIYFAKELDFRISRSYGPGRYDPDYEEKGRDYPYGYVRWTEERNMQAFIQMLAEGKVNPRALITHRFPIQDGSKAYELITGKVDEPFLGVLLTYPTEPDMSRIIRSGPADSGRALGKAKGAGLPAQMNQVNLAVVGAGAFANSTLLSAIKEIPGLKFVGVVSTGGLSARTTAGRFNFEYSATDMQQVLSDPAVNTVAILTRHHLHATQVVAALKAGKHVFVEKPLCLNDEELQEILSQYHAVTSDTEGGRNSPPFLMVGFNRRFSPFVKELKRHLQAANEPLLMHYRVNAGYVPPSHWVQDPAQGGGRLLGEACHFIDLLIHLAGSGPQCVTTRSLPDNGRYSRDNFSITLEFANGSLGIVTYVANGDKELGKELLEVFGGGLSARLDDYRSLVIRHGKVHVQRAARFRQDKGHRGEWEAFVACLRGKGPEPMSLDEIIRSTQVTFAAQRSLQSMEAITLSGELK